MCFSWKTHENIGGSLNSVQYNSDIWIFKGISMWHLSINVFEKKAPLELFFYCLLSCLLRGRKTEDSHWGEVREQPRVLPAQVGQCRSPALSKGSRARLGRGAGPLTVLIIRQKHGDRASLGFTWQVQPASEGSKAQGRVQACQRDGSSQKQNLRACLRQSYLQQGSQGENHKCNKTDATSSNTGHCFKWVGACLSNGITSNLLPSAFIIQLSVPERYRTERYITDWFYGKEFHR